jgi:hypothetical protein
MISVNSELFTLKKISQCFYRPNNGKTLLFYHCIVAFSSGQLLTDKQNRMSKFIPQFSDISVPLTDLTKKNVPNKVKWSDTTQKAFDKLKDCICSDPADYCFSSYVATVKGHDQS